VRPPSHALPLILVLIVAPMLEVWAVLTAPIPQLNYGGGSTSLLAYCVAAPWAAYALSRRNPRARMAGYVFATFDAFRSIHLGHPLPLAVDAAIVLYLQTPAMRALYPSMWSRTRAWRRHDFPA
jgi:hypothetical protein